MSKSTNAATVDGDKLDSPSGYYVVQGRITGSRRRRPRTISGLFESKEEAERELPRLLEQDKAQRSDTWPGYGETMEVVEFVPRAKPHSKQWFWLRDDIAHYVHSDPPGTHYTEEELRGAIKQRSWGSGDRLLPVTPESKDEAYRSMFVPIAEENQAVLAVIGGKITRTAERPTYSD